jgi:glycerophosphoryl diester phosphodiesterase
VTALVIAHRTCPRDAAENSLDGIRFADASGADSVEIDVRLTADSEPVLMHDTTLWRTTRTARRLDRMTLAEVRRLRLRGSDQMVPTLAEALDALGSRLSVAIDVKDPRAADAVLAEVRNQRLEGRAMFWAKSADAVAHAATHAPEIEAALLRDAKRPDDVRRFLDDAVRAGARGVSAHWSVVTPAFVASARSHRLRVYAWCRTRIVDPVKAGLLDGVVTDWPRSARAAIEAQAGAVS